VNPSLEKVFVGMYEYQESSSTRGGGFLVTDKVGTILTTSERDFGCLDAKWLSDDMLVIACSDGIIRWYDAAQREILQETKLSSTTGSGCTENILMTVDSVQDITAAISAKGVLSIIKGRSEIDQWEAHNPVYESWCCGLNPGGEMVVTGSDDCSLKYWDVRTREIVHHDKRNHTMGTTCVEFLDENTLLSGCYDDRIRKFDLRHLAVPMSEFKSIGGIWRMKPHSGKLYVAACYGGCQVLRLDTFDPVEEYKGHESMVYGIGALGDSNVVSCSFYDKSIRFWDLS
jgi:WD40 repeat protein